MGAPPGFPHTLSPEDLTARRHAHVADFLAGRGLDPDWLSSLMRERVGDGQLLLTSSPVHGLANATSDLDFIRVQADEIHGPRISTKIFVDGHHLEVVSFSQAELDANLTELDRLAAVPPAATVAGFRAWDKQREPRRKQTERIVNGIALDGTAPYLPALPALSTVWSRASLHTALEQVVHTALAEAAGESRGRVGYAYNALLHLMDALLSHHGDVYTTRKWYLLRWARFVAEGAWRDDGVRAVGAELERLRTDVAAALDPAAATRPLAGGYVTLAQECLRATGTAASATVRVEVTGTLQPFLPGAALLVAPGGSVVLPGVGDRLPLTGDAIGLDELTKLDAHAAATLLRALRAGAARLDIGYHGEETTA
ncbi:DUF6001 family protein [Streptomyces sp. RGM 3693]|uniref:DUF6001 family protein n=1 Tax=Streptomyces sp. RGM 3693 TaxID=3413284 RepID=UPI003D266560